MSVVESVQAVQPLWSPPVGVNAFTTTRGAGRADSRYGAFNLGDHVGDDAQQVEKNRELTRVAFDLPAAPRWLNQVHGTTVLQADEVHGAPDADASWTRTPGVVSVVLTADCLPLFLASTSGDRVATVHCGWRGLAAGIIDQTLDAGGFDPARTVAGFGPAIGPAAYEVGHEFRDAYSALDPSGTAFTPSSRPGHWYANLYELASLTLVSAGVAAPSQPQFCTASESNRWYSWRGEGVCGRMASLIWIA